MYLSLAVCEDYVYFCYRIKVGTWMQIDLALNSRSLWASTHFQSPIITIRKDHHTNFSPSLPLAYTHRLTFNSTHESTWTNTHRVIGTLFYILSFIMRVERQFSLQNIILAHSFISKNRSFMHASRVLFYPIVSPLPATLTSSKGKRILYTRLKQDRE